MHFHSPALGYVRSAMECPDTVFSNLDSPSLPQDVTLVLHINDIMLVGPSAQEVTITLYLLVGHLNARGWEVNATKSSGDFHLPPS